VIRAFQGKHPRIDPSVFISEAAYVVGDVTIGAGSSVWPGAVVRGDVCAIRIGANTHIEDNSTLHHGPDGIDIGDNVTIGHNVVVHCRRIGNSTLIGNGATLLDGAEIGSNCVVAAGAVVRPGTVAPDFSFLVGVPAQVRPLPEALKGHTSQWNAGYGRLAAQHLASGLGDAIPDPSA
jgi:carbonic anhydrase/acetyltransferase-like protein (isoleucine patch superfamily)